MPRIRARVGNLEFQAGRLRRVLASNSALAPHLDLLQKLFLLRERPLEFNLNFFKCTILLYLLLILAAQLGQLVFGMLQLGKLLFCLGLQLGIRFLQFQLNFEAQPNVARHLQALLY